MPAQGTEYQLLLRKTRDNEETLPSEEADLLFDEAESDYPNYSRKLILQAVVVARLTELVAENSKNVTYQLNELRENLSDTAKILLDLLKKAEAKLDLLLSEEKPVAAAMGNIRRVPTQWRDTP
jgi:hypothetical protein